MTLKDFIIFNNKKQLIQKNINNIKNDIARAKRPIFFGKEHFDKKLQDMRETMAQLELELSEMKMNEENIAVPELDHILIETNEDEEGRLVVSYRQIIPSLSAILGESDEEYYFGLKYISNKHAIPLHELVVWYLSYTYRDDEEEAQQIGIRLNVLRNQGWLDFDEAGEYYAKLVGVPYGQVLPALCKYI
jgi:hypothetical protein